MPATPLDSTIYRDLLGDPEIGKLFTDSAEVRAMLIVEGALAEVQGGLGVIPEISAAAIKRAGLEIALDPAALAKGTGASAVPVPALVSAFRHEMQAPEHAQYVHWGATSQDIVDTALVLRLRQVIAVFEDRLIGTLNGLAALAETHADLPMAGRTYGQVATPTSFGAVAAAWGWPLHRAQRRLEPVREDLLQVSLAGASGTLSAMGERGPEVRAGLAAALGLGDPGGSWHSTRDSIAAFAGWMTQVTGSLGKMGADLTLLCQSEIGEITLPQSGASSTMPQKANPVLPSVLEAIARQVAALNGAVQGALVHRGQRDGAAWITEWLSLPQMCLLTGRALEIAQELSGGLQPRPDRMLANLDDGRGLIFAEAASFALAQQMPRPEAQAEIKAMAERARSEGVSLKSLIVQEYPGEWDDVFNPLAQLGDAPAEARRFAESVNPD